MSDQPQIQPQEGAEQGATQAVTPAVEAEEFDKERALETIKKLREFEKEAKRLKSKVTEYEEAEQKRKEADMSEMDKLKAQYEKAQNELHTLQTNELKRQAAAKHKLPDALALRLQGNTLEELEKDAEELVKTLPKGTVNMGATNPGATTGRKTDEELRAEIFGGGKALFTPGWLEQHGGGVFSVDKED